MATGAPSDYLALIDTTAGNAAQSVTTGLNGNVLALSSVGSTVYVGGGFTSVLGNARQRLAAVSWNGSDLALGAWNPAADGVVRDISVGGGVAYLAGEFATVGGQARAHLAAVNDTTAAVLPGWNPSPNNGVQVVKVMGSKVYVGGQFSSISGSARGRAASYSVLGGGSYALNSWNPDANDTVRAIAVVGDNVYLGGEFTSVSGGAARVRGARWFGGTLMGWNPEANAVIYDLDVENSNVTVSGAFGTLGGNASPGLGLVNGTSGAFRP